MTVEPRPLNVALLALPEVTASTLYGMYDLFCSAGRDWQFLLNGTPGAPLVRPYVVARQRGALKALNEISISPDYTLGEEPAPDIICVSDFFVNPGEGCEGRYEIETAWLREWFEGGAVLASACSGALLLAQAGLLDGYDATIHWGFSKSLARYPKVRVNASRTLVITGPESRLIMGGGGTTWQDLALFLIARFVGVETAIEVAKVHLIEWHELGQQSYATLVSSKQVEDAIIARCQSWLADHYAEPGPVAAMIAMSGLAERSFNRRFVQATGMTPLQYVHAVRIEEAKQLLETSDLAIEAIANEVGYEDSSFFGRLFSRTVGVTPAQYRRRFAPLRKAVQPR